MAKNNQYETYAYLDRLSTEQLEELLRADFASPDHCNEEAIFHILEVMVEREKNNPTGCLPTPGKAWADFQQYYNIPEGKGRSLYPCDPEQEDTSTANVPSRRPYRHIKKRFVVAAILVILLCGMLTAQASGIDFFGALGRWTEETFSFDVFSAEETQTEHEDHSENIIALQKAAATCDIPQSMIPTWIPDGFEPSEPKTFLIEGHSAGVSCLYSNNQDGRTYSVNIKRYYDFNDLQFVEFEKDGSEVSFYQRGEKIFYLMSNLDYSTAAWSDGIYLIAIGGLLDIDEIEPVLDSIGG